MRRQAHTIVKYTFHFKSLWMVGTHNICNTRKSHNKNLYNFNFTIHTLKSVLSAQPFSLGSARLMQLPKNLVELRQVNTKLCSSESTIFLFLS